MIGSCSGLENIQAAAKLRSEFTHNRRVPVTIKNFSDRVLTLDTVTSDWGCLSHNDKELPKTLSPNFTLTFCAHNRSFALTGCAVTIEATLEGDTTRVPIKFMMEHPLVGSTSASVKLADFATSWSSDVRLIECPDPNTGGKKNVFVASYVDDEEVVFIVDVCDPRECKEEAGGSNSPRTAAMPPTKKVSDLTYYELLGVDPTATDSDIRRAYRRQALHCHPDKNRGDPDADAKFKKLVRAYETLNDAEKRSKYDTYGAKGDSGASASAEDSHAILKTLFGGGAFNDYFGVHSAVFSSDPANSALSQRPEEVHRVLRGDYKRLAAVLHNRITRLLSNRASFERDFEAEVKQLAQTPGGDVLLRYIGDSYCAVSKSYGESGVCCGFTACMNNRRRDTQRCGTMCGLCCSSVCFACGASCRASEIQRKMDAGELDADEATEAQRQLHEDVNQKSLDIVFLIGLLEVESTVDDIAKQTLYGFFQHSSKEAGYAACRALNRIGLTMYRIGCNGKKA